ncbi:DoxX family protein [Natrinema salifodinae]|uniref:Putative oxidoreductase n=1 Tax=Natrinema salifodinae TaxID=1202768 RepID=A0A1I0Q8W0_9EURY|nr:DoxX family protein [Natrinema salifodinae]SEW23301.1 putative oxidoreductase [Natrinema salifodinae]
MSRSTAAGGTQWNPVVLRLALGIALAVAGVGKLFTVGPKATAMSEFAGTLASLGVPAPTVVAWCVALAEASGGLLLLVGLLTRYAAAVGAAIMFVATTLVHLPNGFVASDGGFEYTLVLFLVAVALVLSGPGALSLERAVFDDELLVPVDATRG